MRIRLFAHPSQSHQNPTKVRSSRGIGETRIGTFACCRHSRKSLFDSRVSATVADACAPWRRDVLTQRSGRVWFSNPFAEPDTLLEAESTRRALTCHCVLENGVGSERHQVQWIHKFLLSQKKAAVRKCLVLIPRSPLKCSFEF